MWEWSDVLGFFFFGPVGWEKVIPMIFMLPLNLFLAAPPPEDRLMTLVKKNMTWSLMYKRTSGIFMKCRCKTSPQIRICIQAGRPLAAYESGQFKSSPKANQKPSDDLGNHRLNIGYTALNLTVTEEYLSIWLFQWRFLSFYTILNTIIVYFSSKTLFLYYLFDLTWYKGGQTSWPTAKPCL